jgi:hypothetical protein
LLHGTPGSMIVDLLRPIARTSALTNLSPGNGNANGTGRVQGD